ncbi:hypothetical protein ACKWTF_003632 [Chironomus riparius]
MAEINIIDLHEEILKKIIFYASNEKIKELTEVCTKFNNVIGSSAKLMDKFVIVWKEVKFKDVKPLLLSKRKYRNIEIEEIGLHQDLVHFLNSHSSTLTELSINNSSLSIFDCELIFKIVGDNILDLKLYGVNIWGEKETVPVNFPKMESLYLNATRHDKMSLIFNFFIGANTDILIYRESRSLDEQEITALSQMIASFHKLAVLDVGIFELQLFENDFLTKNANFKLEICNLLVFNVLYGRSEEFINRRYVHLLSFLKSQRSNLNELNITNLPITSDVIECIHDLENLQDLTIHSYSSHFIQKPSKTNTSIKNLTIILDCTRVNPICEIISSCADIQHLTVVYSSFTFDLALSIVNHLKNLQKIVFNKLIHIFPMTIPTVTSMDFIDIMNIDSIIRVLQVNRQLKFIKIPRILETHPKYEIAMDGLDLETLEFN